ncbi:MAG TPA: saccharopine dehydrogenase NADP-binding domain-containing protein [Rhodanobacteraceae bacterium]|jgi:short subunit dehydrogenase-like uncharacterized protein|nr:saccharopine dehydrogenase NADP-binding domain-containing protein [Rhodanobacteraceae bacterium]
MSRILIYGANGYTGALIAEEATRRGLKPILAGRNRDALEVLAQQLKTTRRVFELRDPAEIARNLEGIDVLLNCAGPFVNTCAPLLEACLAHKIHYLDITGEIDVFALCHHAHLRAKHQRIVVAPGVGFDVVPTDCVAAMLKQRLPDASELVLAFEAGGGPSPGTARTSIAGLAAGGRVRRNGELVDVPLAFKAREFERDGVKRCAMTIPWGDVYTAFISTGIRDIETYMAVSPKTIARMRWLRYVQPLLRFDPVRKFLEARAVASARGPDAERRRATGCHVWGEARSAWGREEKLELKTPNGYALTVDASLGILEYVLRANVPGGYYTPSQLVGADFVLKLPGVALA